MRPYAFVLHPTTGTKKQYNGNNLYVRHKDTRTCRLFLVSQGLTENQNRLLYVVSLYTHKADTRGDKDHWLRKPALVVLLYEGIVANVLDFDYAPQSELIENRRIWMNVSQVRRVTHAVCRGHSISQSVFEFKGIIITYFHIPGAYSSVLVGCVGGLIVDTNEYYSITQVRLFWNNDTV